MRILRHGLALFRGVGGLLAMALFLLVYAFTRIFVKHTKESGLRLRNMWLKWIAYPILNIKETVKGNPINGSALYVCNHRNFVDPVVLCKHLDAFVIAKAEIGKYPIISKGAEATGVIYVKREEKQSRSNVRKALVSTIQEGYNILVYPEGTISIIDEPLPFKKGTFFEAAKQDITVVPVAIEYRDKDDLWLKKNLFHQYLWQFGKWSTHVKLSFGPPIKSIDGEQIADHCYSWIKGEMDSMRENWITHDFE